MSNDIKSGIRVRMAPSPTGWLHLGTARTALFNWLFAKKTGGTFVVRVEDTDTERSKKEYEDDIIKGFKWLGLNYDEGPDVGGEYGPYRQSERGEIYKKHIKKLLDEEKAYFCFCSKEELEEERNEMMKQGIAPKYSGKCRSISKEKAQERVNNRENYVIRIKSHDEVIDFHDLIRGKISTNSSIFGDIVIARNIDSPLYLFAVIVDDYEMKISHVIRGEDHISNTPKQILIQRALGFDEVEYAHLPLILAPDRSKLSKRSMETSLNAYKDDGYLPEAIVNFMAYLGWHPQDDKEVMTQDEIASEFDISRVQKGGAVFNIEKLDWLNAQYIKMKSVDELRKLLADFIPAEWGSDEQKLVKAIAIEKERMKKLTDFKESADFVFEMPEYEGELLIWKEMTQEEVKENLDIALTEIENMQDEIFEKANEIEQKLMPIAEEKGRGQFLWPLRVSLSGKKNSPSPFELIYILGREETARRINFAIEKLNV